MDGFFIKRPINPKILSRSLHQFLNKINKNIFEVFLSTYPKFLDGLFVFFAYIWGILWLVHHESIPSAFHSSHGTGAPRKLAADEARKKQSFQWLPAWPPGTWMSKVPHRPPRQPLPQPRSDWPRRLGWDLSNLITPATPSPATLCSLLYLSASVPALGWEITRNYELYK